jgi:hypothetical protein
LPFTDTISGSSLPRTRPIATTRRRATIQARLDTKADAFRLMSNQLQLIVQSGESFSEFGGLTKLPAGR